MKRPMRILKDLIINWVIHSTEAVLTILDDFIKGTNATGNQNGQSIRRKRRISLI
jgi:hypothetical protein